MKLSPPFFEFHLNTFLKCKKIEFQDSEMRDFYAATVIPVIPLLWSIEVVGGFGRQQSRR